MVFHYFTVAIVSLCACRTDAASLTSVRGTQDGAQPEPFAVKGRSASLRVTPPPPMEMSMALSSRAISPAKQKVKLEIHYETLCPYCTTLIGTHLQSIWNDTELRGRLDVSMFPAGNAQVFPVEQLTEGFRSFHPELVKDGFGHVFRCQHGEEECLGNMIQACAIKELDEPAKYLPFLFCMEAAASNEESIENAAFNCLKKTTTLSADAVFDCTQTAQANKMMFSISNYSNSLTPQRQYVPWVVINGEHEEEADNGNLLGTLCRAFEPPLPSACKGVEADKSHGQGIFGKVGHWLGAVQMSKSHDLKGSNRSAEFCYP